MNATPSPQGFSPPATGFLNIRSPMQSNLAFAVAAYCLGQSGCSMTARPWIEVQSMARTAGYWAVCLGIPLALFAAAIAWRIAGRITRFRLGPFEFDCAPAEKPAPAPTVATASTTSGGSTASPKSNPTITSPPTQAPAAISTHD